MSDPFDKRVDQISAPARRVFDVVPHDTNEVSPLPKALRIKTAGNITFRAVDSDTDITWAVVAGETLPIRPKFIRATGTNATCSALA